LALFFHFFGATSLCGGFPFGGYSRGGLHLKGQRQEVLFHFGKMGLDVLG